MKKIELAGAFTILGVLLVSQLWSGAHDNMSTPGNEAGAEDPAPGAMTAVAPNMAIANLAVTGMI
jgi:hypothetical protein